MIRSAPDTSWIVQADGVVLVNSRRRTAVVVRYPEAAVWDLLTRHPVAEVTRKVACIASLEREEAERVVRSAIDQWVAQGFLREEAGGG